MAFVAKVLVRMARAVSPDSLIWKVT